MLPLVVVGGVLLALGVDATYAMLVSSTAQSSFARVRQRRRRHVHPECPGSF